MITELSCDSLEINIPEVYKTLQEGSAKIQVQQKVFYNPVQEFNRDLSIAVLNEYASSIDGGIKILEALSATGLRSIRYAKEVNNVRKIIANDLSKTAVDAITRNVANNDVNHLIKVKNFDAVDLMNKKRNKKFDAIDLDPYGCPSIYLDAAVRSIKDGGLLLVTATDMAVLAGNSPESCYVKYGSISLKIKSCHEMALRILLQTIQAHANRYGRYIKPILSISADFYVRVFVTIFTSPLTCKLTTSKLSMVYHCTTCGTFSLQPLGQIKQDKKNTKYTLPQAPSVNMNCFICNGHYKLGGPIWTGSLHNYDFIQNILINPKTKTLSTWSRINGMLSVILEELPDCPLYYSVPACCSALQISTPPLIKIRSAVLNAGFRVSMSHCLKDSIKSDAPVRFLWAIFCQLLSDCGKQLQDVNNIPTVIFRNCYKPEEYKIDFSLCKNANPVTRKQRLLRFQENPLPNWGPGTRSTTMITGNENTINKRKKDRQNRKKKHRINNNEEC